MTGSCKPWPRLVAVQSDISIHRSTGSCFSVSLRVLDDCANLHWKAYKIPESVLQDALQRAMQNQPLGYSMVGSAQFVHCYIHTVIYGSTVPDSRFVATLCKYKEHTPDEGSFTTCYSSGQSRWDPPLLLSRLSSAAPKCAAFACQVLTVQATWHLRSSIVLVQS